MKITYEYFYAQLGKPDHPNRDDIRCTIYLDCGRSKFPMSSGIGKNKEEAFLRAKMKLAKNLDSGEHCDYTELCGRR